ncbi:MAG: hypothetical protein ACQEUB_08440 [Thermodesulfobacteriota bacterium]
MNLFGQEHKALKAQTPDLEERDIPDGLLIIMAVDPVVDQQGGIDPIVGRPPDDQQIL